MTNDSDKMSNQQEDKLRVGIIGTGKIGTDLLLKIVRSPHLTCTLFSGRNLASPGMMKAQEMGVRVSDIGIFAFRNEPGVCDLVFDATSAQHHKAHSKLFALHKIKAIDLTPAKVGAFCIPAINEQLILSEQNINMVTCGGQASVPMAAAVSKVCRNVKALSVHTLVSHDSIGQATLDNIDEYYSTTAGALKTFGDVDNVEVDLEVADESETPTMLTTLRFDTGFCDQAAVIRALYACEKNVQSYAPGYKIIGEPRFDSGILEVKVQVRGQGDWIPEHAGNLDIINCAAIGLAERYAVEYKQGGARTLGSVISSVKNFAKRSRYSA